MVQETTGQQRQPAMVGMSLPRQDGPDKVTGRARMLEIRWCQECSMRAWC
jgi:hypothetical protein